VDDDPGGALKLRPSGMDRFQIPANFQLARQIGIGAAVARRPLPHHGTYGSRRSFAPLARSE